MRWSCSWLTTSSPTGGGDANGGARRALPLGGQCLVVHRASPMRAAFAAAGGVPAERVWCTLGSDGAGRATGFGTVRFPDAASAERALTAMQGTALDGRQLLVRLDRRAGVATASRLQKASRKMEAQLAELEGAADEIDPEVQGEIEATMLASEREELRLAQVQILIATPRVHRHGPSTARVPLLPLPAFLPSPPFPPRRRSPACGRCLQPFRRRHGGGHGEGEDRRRRAEHATAVWLARRRVVVHDRRLQCVVRGGISGAPRAYSAMAGVSALRRATYPDAQVRGPPTVRVAADRFAGVAASRPSPRGLPPRRWRWRVHSTVWSSSGTLAVRAQHGPRAAVLEMAAEMSGELGSKSGEPFSSPGMARANRG